MKTKIGILTSSRADYGIYKRLLANLSQDNRFDLHIITFGTHLLEKFGLTIQEIRKDDFGVIHEVLGMPILNSLTEIGKGYGDLVKSFTEFWNKNNFDWVFALGDRFEMSAAVQASIPFEVKIVHLHGGETTMGAIDNIYRHQISLASSLHLVASEEFKNKVIEITGQVKNVYNVGALSLDGIEEMDLPPWKSVCKKFAIPYSPFVLVTIHPETVGVEKNKDYVIVITNVLEELKKQARVVITMPNADPLSDLYRDAFINLKKLYPSDFFLVENFGKSNYFSAMKACKYVIGNSSSGIIEAASFKKYVVNIGKRQEGRLRSNNVKDVPFDKVDILKSIEEIDKRGDFKGRNKYYEKNSAKKIIEIITNA